MMNNRNLSSRVALGGIVAALGIVIMFLTGVLPALYIAAPMAAGLLMIILAVLVLSPIDALPDVIPVVGWVDDVAYVAGILGTVVGMLKGKRAQQIPGAPGAQGYIPPMYNEVSSNRKK